jgi:hypothetical protein
MAEKRKFNMSTILVPALLVLVVAMQPHWETDFISNYSVLVSRVGENGCSNLRGSKLEDTKSQ